MDKSWIDVEAIVDDMANTPPLYVDDVDPEVDNDYPYDFIQLSLPPSLPYSCYLSLPITLAPIVARA